MKIDRLRIAALALCVSLGGCVGDQAERVHSVWRPADLQWRTERVFFVTDRVHSSMWGGFGKEWSDRAACGSREAVVPPANLASEPVANGKVSREPDIACAGAGGPLSGAAHAIAEAARRKGCDRVLIYVHGFNTLFDGAVLRAGQMALDAQSGCVAAVFSWSSEGVESRYVADIEHSAYATPLLEAFLRALARERLRIDILAHSVGARVTLSALASMAAHDNPPPENFIDQLILAAADVGVEPLNNDFFHLLDDARPFVRRTTIYASAGDAVLVVSEGVHGEVPRAGREPAADRLKQTPEAERPAAQHLVDVVDATDAPAELLGHSYFGLSYEAVRDITLALDGVPAERRLRPEDGWPATLVCKPEGKPCGASRPRYALKVAPDRKPSWISRFIRRLAPILRRVDFPAVGE
ncbi:MAG TPA: alpha/beta hydrolase [Rhizomicrobium sp.]|jgi:esterase/lipase superfamily enzyme|nr:alpha/beta hydrolase [Rhizomicrobium sp.]